MPKIVDREFFPDYQGVHHLPEGNGLANDLNPFGISIGLTVAIMSRSVGFPMKIASMMASIS